MPPAKEVSQCQPAPRRIRKWRRRTSSPPFPGPGRVGDSTGTNSTKTAVCPLRTFWKYGRALPRRVQATPCIRDAPEGAESFLSCCRPQWSLSSGARPTASGRRLSAQEAGRHFQESLAVAQFDQLLVLRTQLQHVRNQRITAFE